AGKSIAIDALGLCLGGRAEADMVRTGAARADLCARFSLKDTPAGKSIAIDALGLCLGGRAEADMVRTGAARADLC
nr:hypothetical protein [Klebsiella pneumoniae]